MGRASTEKHPLGHRQLIAAQRAAARQRRTRNRLLLAGGVILTVVAVTLTLVFTALSTRPGPTGPPADGPTGAELAGLASQLTSVPASVLDKVGTGSLTGDGVGSPGTSGGGYLGPVTGTPLTEGGKPEVLYVGADYCPYCAAVRWPLIVALSRFGTFSGLTTTRSGVANGAGQGEIYPATATWTFYGARYTSRYLAFTGIELATSTPDPKTGQYTTLQSLTSAQKALLMQYDSQGGIPVIDIGNRYVQLSNLAPYGPQALAGLPWSQIVTALRDPSSTLARQVDASANYLTAAFCRLTGNQPASACTPVVRALEPRVG
jgi:hypothetical protein